MPNLVTLPRLESPAAVAPAHAGVTLPPATVLAGDETGLPPILLADDDQDDVFFVQRLIKKTGVKNRVIAFDDGSAVVNYLSKARLAAPQAAHRTPLLLFLDLKMRGLGGLGFLEWARDQKELSPLTVVVLTNSSDPQDMARALELGAHRYLVKYPSAQTFESIVRGVYPQTVY